MTTSYKSTSDDETPLIIPNRNAGRKRTIIPVDNPDCSSSKKASKILSDSSDSDVELDSEGFFLGPHEMITVSDAFELKKIHRLFEKLPKSVNDTIYLGGEKWQQFLDEVSASYEKVCMIIQEAKNNDSKFKKSSEYKNLKISKAYRVVLESIFFWFCKLLLKFLLVKI